MTDSYYELIDADDPLGEKFAATDLVRSTWTAAIQHAAPVSALLVRALERCARRFAAVPAPSVPCAHLAPLVVKPSQSYCCT